MSSFITSIATANPTYKIPQQDVLEFMVGAHGLEAHEAKKLRALYRATGIHSRYSVIEDYSSASARTFFPPAHDLEPFPSTRERMELFRTEAIKLCEAACKSALADTPPKEVTHLITVSCTGMYAPGIDIELIDRLGMNTFVERTGINFMGCYAALNALKVANAICTASERARVLIVCVELCSIHFQKEKSDDYLLANALFGDGAAAVIVQGRPGKGISLQPEAFYNDLIRSGGSDMAWKIGDFGFEMRLSAYVPGIIESGIPALIKKLQAHTGAGKFGYYAIHPGGRKILEVIEKELGISRQDNFAAHEVLSEYGNMSSPTILFVLKKLWDRLNNEQAGRNILMMAFGPGLTLESAILTIEHR